MRFFTLKTEVFHPVLNSGGAVMLTKIINSGFLLYKSDANMVRIILGKIPFFKNTSKMSEKTANVLGEIKK